ncbi:19165_t:CDS:1, partial [Entrophospora sp. SA101]
KMFEFKHFENLHILPTNDDNVNITLRRLKTIQKCFCYSDKKSNSSPEEIIIILKSFGLVFVEKEFNENFAPKETRLENYVFNITDVVAVLKSLKSNRQYPNNLLPQQLNKQNSLLFSNYLAKYLKKYTRLDQLLLEPKNYIIEVLKYLPIYSEVDENDKLIDLVVTNKKWFLLPTEDEQSYGKIIVPKNKDGFLH